MALKDIKFEKYGDIYELSRPQWGNHKARISVYPGLLDKVLRHTWTYTKGKHPYLTTIVKSDNGEKHTVSLHRFVLNHLYGTHNVAKMLEPDNIIEHLDNDGLNCSYDNLHILSADYNKAKAFTIDKEPRPSFAVIQTFVTGVYYSHKKKRYQVQIVFNRDVIWHHVEKRSVPVERIHLIYYDFQQLFVDWLNLMKFRKLNKFDLSVLRPAKGRIIDRPQFEVTEEEKNAPIIVRDGIPYLVLKTEGDNDLAFIVKTAYQDLDDL